MADDVCMFCGLTHECTCGRVVYDCPHCGALYDVRHGTPLYRCLMPLLTSPGTCRLTKSRLETSVA